MSEARRQRRFTAISWTASFVGPPIRYVHGARNGRIYRIPRDTTVGPPKEYFLKLGRGEL